MWFKRKLAPHLLYSLAVMAQACREVAEELINVVNTYLPNIKPVGSCQMSWHPFLTLMSDTDQALFLQDSKTVTKLLISAAAWREVRQVRHE